MIGYLKATGLVILLLFLVTFGIKNDQLVKLHYFFGFQSRDFPLYILAYGCAVIGIFVGMIIGITNRFHQRKKIQVLEKYNHQLKASVEKNKKEAEKDEKQWNQKAEEEFQVKKFFDEERPEETRPAEKFSGAQTPDEPDFDQQNAEETDLDEQNTDEADLDEQNADKKELDVDEQNSEEKADETQIRT